jgi:uncharacterized protein (TIGR02231 family)
MKKVNLFVISVLFPFYVFGQNNQEIKVSSKIDAVKLYIGGAQVTRSASVNLAGGNSTVVFKDLPSTLDASTFQVQGEGAFTILSIKEGFSNKSQTLPKEAQQIKDSLTLMIAQKEDLEMLQSVLDDEEKFLNLNRSIGGQQTGINSNELKNATEFYRTRLSEIKKGQLANRRKIVEVTQQIERLKARLYPFTSGRVSLNQELAIMVLADKPTKAKIVLSYFTSAAGWIPSYDIRSNGQGEAIQLILRANASNSTGENWENTLFSFNTGLPAVGATPPAINPWFLRPVIPPKPASYNRSKLEMAPAAQEVYEYEEDADKVAGSSYDFTVKQDALTATEYSLPIAYSLATGRDPLVVEIEKSELNADYEYLAIPKLSPYAYLMAKIPNLEGLNLLSANASIYLGGAYTGSAFIDPSMASDTLNLPLGIDQAISIERNRIKDYKSKRFIGSKITETVGWELSIRNKKNIPIRIKLLDQIPVSTDKNIQVLEDNISGGSLNKETGIIAWNIKLDAGGNQTIRLTYKVEYPKDLRLILE